MGDVSRTDWKSWPTLARHGRLAERVLRAQNIALALMLLLFTAPVIALAALAMRCETRGPMLEPAERSRVGHDFRRFRLRTTSYDASALWWRGERTTIGQFLHYTRIDTLPQLMNVLRGEMSVTDRNRHRPELLD